MNKSRFAAALVLLIFLCGCTRPKTEPPAPTGPRPPDAAAAEPTATAEPYVPKSGSAKPPQTGYTVTRVFFATDRNREAGDDPADMFGVDMNASQVSYGTCYVTIPGKHKPGELEGPSVWRLSFSEDPEKHIVLTDVKCESRDAFFSQVAEVVKNSAKKKAFVFIHGYRVTFKDAARRTAQMSYDLGFQGAPVFYSWSSSGTFLGYDKDEETVELTQSHLRSFLDDFFARSDAEEIYLIAHSMGSRAVTQVISDFVRNKPVIKQRVVEVVLAAPDMNAELFKQRIAPVLADKRIPVTVYASSDDLALAASQAKHRYPRAGDSGDGLVAMPGIETIDASGLRAGLLGHSYFMEAPLVINDIKLLFLENKRAAQRTGLTLTPKGNYWVIRNTDE